jgi:hypothetical protein
MVDNPPSEINDKLLRKEKKNHACLKDITSAQILYACSILLIARNCPRKRPRHRYIMGTLYL